VAGGFGNTYSIERVVATAAGSGAASEIQGGNFSDGFNVGGALALVTYGATAARAYELASSPSGSIGDSPGALGLPGKLGGSRPEISGYDAMGLPKIEATTGTNFLGGMQGEKGHIGWAAFGYNYAPGSLTDKVVEQFAGVHDLFNHPWTYDANGYVHQSDSLFGRAITNFTGSAAVARAFSETMSWVNVPLTSPFVAASAVPQSSYFLTANRSAWRK
jgi:filamentous hemagglutinin